MNQSELPIITILIATFNSGKLLPRTLKAIREQTYPQNKIEILAIDGGSTDNTRKILDEYDCQILLNPETEPVNAKLIGTKHARGKYILTIDHDEVMLNKQSIMIKVQALVSNPECKAALCSGYKRPQNYPLLNEYISEYGDPYSFFIYRFSKGFFWFEKVINKHYSVVRDTNKYMVISFEAATKPVIIELLCAGTMIDREYFQHYCSDKALIGHLFYIMLGKNETHVVITHNDPLEHYSVDSLKAYWPKLKWRVINNVFAAQNDSAGFSGRTKYQSKLKYKKFLFLPYAFVLPFPLFDGIYLAITRKNAIYLMHPIFCLYVSFQILVQYTKKILGIKPTYTSYDGKKIISPNK